MRNHAIQDDEIIRSICESVYVSDAGAAEEIPAFRNLPEKVVEQVFPIAPPFVLSKCAFTSVADAIVAVMLSRKVRRGKRSLIEPFIHELRGAIEVLVKGGQPITFVLPTLPFKDQSPFVTNAAIDHVDLGEYAFFVQLKRMMQAIRTVYEPGAHFTLLCDGYIYAGIFANGDVDGAGRYKAQCERIKNEFGLHNDVTLFDMREVLFDMPAWKDVLDRVHGRIQSLAGRHADVRDRIAVLARRFTYHVALKGVSYEEARATFMRQALPDWVAEQLRGAALQYAALHVTLKHMKLIERAFPAAIRCTVHPKAAAQFPLHLTHERNTILPYNGVATLSRTALADGHSVFDALRIMRFCDVLRHEYVTAMRVGGHSDPYYYELP